MRNPVNRLLGDTPLIRSLSWQSILSATGDGAFLTGSAVFFTQIVGLSAAQVGLGLTIGGIASFLLAVPLGKLSDRFGAKQVWSVTCVLECLIYASWFWADSMATFILVTVALESVQVAGRAARNAYRFEIFPREQRVRSNAYFRAARNVGYTLGALLAGVALATGSNTVIRAVPIATAAILILNAALIVRLPGLHTLQSEDAETGLEEALHAHDGGAALRNYPYVATAILDGVLATHQVLLNVVIPLWLVEETDAPRVLLAWLFGTNTVMAVCLQVAAARGVVDVADSLRAQRRGAFFFVASCAIILVTHDTVGWVTIALVWLGHVTVTGAELFNSAGDWGLQAELADPNRRGEYQGVSQLGYTVGTVWAPAAYTFLAMQWGTAGWLTIAGIIVVAAIAIHPTAYAAERRIKRPAEQALSEPA
ncbi:MAG TPA: MFS transporter [Nocardioides sp.]|nr:MFS transporter [Nocardioides sp.]